MANSRDIPEKEKLYILLKDTPGSLKSKYFSYGFKLEQCYYVTRGELLKKDNKKNESELISLVSIETPELCVAVNNIHVRLLKQEEFEILHAVPSKMERFDLLNSPLFPEILMININDEIAVTLDNKNLQEYKGKVRYIGPVQHKKGKHFGILFKNPMGDMDGTVDNVTLFPALKKFDVVVSADRIINISKKNFVSEILKVLKRRTHIHNLNEYALFKTGSRVVRFYENTIHRGTIRFLGYVTKHDNAVYAGVELDKELRGNNTGNLLEGRKIFDCGRNRGLIVEAVELIREEDFDHNKKVQPTNHVQNEPSKWQDRLEQFQEKQWSGETEAAKPRISDELKEKENERAEASNIKSVEKPMKKQKEANISVVAEEYFSCMICLDPAVDAVESLCCHKIFCDHCAKDCMDQPCPNCRTNPFDVTASFIARQFLGNLQIDCSNDRCNRKPPGQIWPIIWSSVNSLL